MSSEPQKGEFSARPFDARALGWYGGNCHCHLWRHAREAPLKPAEAAARGAAAGLDFLLLTPPWDDSDAWRPAEELDRRCREVQPAGLALGWSIEAPKCPIAEPEARTTGNAWTHGHGWAVGLHDLFDSPHFFTTGPNFPIIQEIHRQGGVVGCAHPARLLLREGAIAAGWATELPFDFLSGSGYDAMDVVGPAGDDPATAERAWYALLNLGYRVAATAGTGGTDAPGRFRTYVRMTGTFSWQGLLDGIRQGATMASSGPLVVFEVGGGPGPGHEYPADGAVRSITVRAWAGGDSDARLQAVQLVRNGEITRVWDLASQGLRDWQGAVEVAERDFAWYTVRVISDAEESGEASARRSARETAIASPVYFLPPGFARPAPATARFHLRVTDTADRLVACRVVASMQGRQVSALDLPPGPAVVEVPAGARLSFEAPGFAPEKRSAFGDSPVGDYCRNLSMARLAQDAPRVWLELRRLLDRIELPVRMLRLYDFKNESGAAPVVRAK